MSFKEFLAILLLFILVFVGLSAMNISYGAELNVTRDFDNITIYHTVKSDSGSQTVQGIENNAKLMSKDGKLMTNGIYEDDNGRYEYEGMYLNDTLLNRNDRVYFKEPVLLTANYKFTPFYNASITIIDPVGNTDSYVDFPHMTKEGDSLTHVFREPVDVDTVHYDFWYITDETRSIYLQPGEEYCISYTDCLANNGSINKVFTYTYGYFPDYTVTYIATNNETGIVFDNQTFVINRNNWSAFYQLPNAQEVEHKVLNYIHIVEDDITNYNVGDTYQVDYDMAMGEGNNITRTFIYHYKEGEYANVTINYIINATGSEYDNLVFSTVNYPYLVVNDELIAGYVNEAVDINGYEFTGVSFQEIITNDVKAMLPGSNVHDEGGFWIYEVNETGTIDLNFIYNYKAIKVDPTPEPTPVDPQPEPVDPVDPTPEPTPTPAPGNETDDNNTEPIDPVDPVDPVVPDVVDNKTNGDDKNVINNNNCSNNVTNNISITNDNTNSSKLSIEPITMKQTGIGIAFGIFGIIILFIVSIIFCKDDED